MGECCLQKQYNHRMAPNGPGHANVSYACRFVFLKIANAAQDEPEDGWNLNCSNLSSQKKAALGRIWLRQAAFQSWNTKLAAERLVFNEMFFRRKLNRNIGCGLMWYGQCYTPSFFKSTKPKIGKLLPCS